MKLTFICKHCGKECIKDISKKDLNKNHFCNRSCAAKFNNKGRIQTEQTKEKIKNTLKGQVKPLKTRVCIVCGKTFTPKRLQSGRISCSNTCSKECHHILIKNNGIQIYKTCVKTELFKVENLEILFHTQKDFEQKF